MSNKRMESDRVSKLQQKGIALAALALGLSPVLSAKADVAVENASCQASAPAIHFDSTVSSPFRPLVAGMTRVMPGHIPHAIKKMSDVGKMDETQVIPVTIALQLNNESDLDNRIAQIYQSGSPSYHQFLTPADFKARYSPTEEQVAREKAFLEANGIAVQSVSDNRVLLSAQGSVSALNQVFGTELHQYLHTDGKLYFAPAYDLQAPVGSQISAVIGMNNLAHFHNHLKKQAKPADGTQEGTAPGGGLAPADIITAYGVPSSATGSGQTMALFELDGYDPTDIAAYEQQFQLPNITLRSRS
jgi:kumamolisin